MKMIQFVPCDVTAVFWWRHQYLIRHLACVQLLIRHLALFLDFDPSMTWCIHHLKNYKIISSERAGLNDEDDILHLYFLCYDTIEDSCDLSSYTEIATPIYIQSYLSDIFCGKTCNTFKKPTHKNYDEPPEVIFFQILWNL